MIETEDLSPPLTDAYRLPPELWLKVFNFATLGGTEVEREFDTRVARDGLYDNDRVGHVSSLKRAQAARLNIALVCRTWYDLSVHHLYRSMRVARPGNLIPLTNTLLKPLPIAADETPRRLGELTQRLDIVLHFSCIKKGDDPPPDDSRPSLPEFLISLPRLTSLVLDCQLVSLPSPLPVASSEFYVPSSLIDDLCTHMSGLTSLEIRRLSLHWRDAEQLLRRIPNLRTLSGTYIDFPASFDSPGLSSPSTIPSLHTLSLKSMNHHTRVEPDCLPNLRHLTLRDGRFLSDTRNESFLRSVGHTLVTVHCAIGDRKIQSRIWKIGRYCPNLQRLVLSIPERTFFDSQSFPLPLQLALPPITCLGLRTSASANSPDDVSYTHIWRSIRKIHRLAPSIAVVQFLNIDVCHEEALENVPSDLLNMRFEYYYRD